MIVFEINLGEGVFFAYSHTQPPIVRISKGQTGVVVEGRRLASVGPPNSVARPCVKQV